MTKEEVLSRLYDRYIRPTEQKRGNYIGVEIEMPIVNLNNEAVDFEVIHQLTAVFLVHFEFVPVGFDEAGHIYFPTITWNFRSARKKPFMKSTADF